MAAPAPAPAPDAFEKEALPHLESLYRMALHLTGEPAPAQDLVQDTMLKAFRAWHQFRPGTNARSWLLTILRNTFINDYRRRRREPVLADLDSLEPSDVYRSVADADPEGTFFSSIVDDRVLHAVNGLPLEFREVVALSDVEGLPYADIAEILKIPVGTVKSRLSRARRLLQRELYDHAVEMGYIRARSPS
ncbi:MAG: sigma-70 family RNA polymerase sigma factor [Gemmatimonadales bacterium]